MKKVVGEFKVEYLQVLDEKGNCDKNLMPKLSKKQIKDLYKAMILGRQFDNRALNLQRQGRIATYPSILGQEASQVGSAYAFDKSTWIFPSFREHAALILRGVPMEKLYLYYAGDERGNVSAKQKCFPTSVPVSTHNLHAVGFAWGNKIQKKKATVVTYFGDGGTSEGDFHESMNFAGVFNLPVIFICQNNQYAISIPREQQTASKTLAQKAIAYGFPGIQVDGNDIFAVYKATQEAMKHVKSGKGPYFIECVTYRLSHHTTADDWTRYRTKKEVDAWSKKDPVLRLKNYMLKNNFLTEKENKKILKDAEIKVEKAVKKFESVSTMKPEDMFQYMYKEMPWNLQEQLQDLKESLGEGE
ncbi:MAG: pyruvate dehydrogenase (acetyl-transferring) E1 component subunit alpha [Candidatus Nanoarchaeia archaeon]|nr:pyruvate dehydrogenase (acetyl-transferring) E1 component subunit alpha [Candidatus Nanoarchaeia archaeon]